MSQPYVGEIRIFAGNFAPSGWMLCEGQLLPISGNETLFNLIGTTYGGDGVDTFALPDLRGRIPIHVGAGGGATYTLAQQAGVEEVTLTPTQIPAHTHAFLASTNIADQTSPAGAVVAQPSVAFAYFGATPNTPLAPVSIAGAGGSQPHTNFQPYLCVNFIISLYGLFPTQT